MSPAADLIRHVLGHPGLGEDEAAAIIDAALQLGVDPLDHCAHHYGIGDALVFERAAGWAGLRHAAGIDDLLLGEPEPLARIGALGEVRTIRAGATRYAAPRFQLFLQLREGAASGHPALAQLRVTTPRTIRAALSRLHAGALLHHATQRLAERWPGASGHGDLTRIARLLFVLGLAGLAAVVSVAPFLLHALFVPLVGVLLIIPALIKFLAVFLRETNPVEAAPLLDDAGLPVYSVLIPLYDEAHMVPQLRRAMAALDYPPEKLDIKFVVEERSPQTIAAVGAVLDDPRFEMVVVPDGMPRTKPKALNYALPLARGEYVVVYDAEDIPDPGQLRLAASRFDADPGLDCLQAELIVDNAAENALTALFAGEYAGQFGLMMPLLARLGLPMPLGGTSNHFRTRSLRELGGWDAYNVTEDADLGVRLSRLRYRTAMLPSATWEEAPISLAGWMRQRTRWMKGWMQVWIVHNCSPLLFLGDIGWRGFIAFQIYIGSMIISALLHSVFVVSATAGLLLGASAPDLWGVVNGFILVAGYGGAAAIAVAGLLRLGKRELLAAQLLLPFYWMLHTVACGLAAWELLMRPHFWAKTQHGQTRLERAALAQPAPQLL